MFFNIYYFKCCWNVQNLAVDVIGSVNTSSLISFRVNFHVMPAWDTIDCHQMKVACGFNGHCSGIRAKGYISKKLIADCFQIGQCLPLLLFPWTACVHRAICSLKCDWSVILSLWKKTRKPVFFLMPIAYRFCIVIYRICTQKHTPVPVLIRIILPLQTLSLILLWMKPGMCAISQLDNFFKKLVKTFYFINIQRQLTIESEISSPGGDNGNL